ncbi:MAG: hypothetical protein IJD55_01865 [Clostridia bacterium]|nr:hypothetical protein [Clostridia bacterium]
MFRQRKKIVVFIISIILLLCCICIPVSASSIYQLPVNQPRTDNQSGYIEYIVRNSDGTLMPFVTFWQLNCDNMKANGETDVFPLVDVVVNYSGIFLSCTLSQYDSSLGSLFTFSGGSVNSAGGYNYWSDDFVSDFTISRVAYEGTVVGFKIYGNGTLIDTNINNDIKWNMSYSETSVLYEAIMSLAQASVNSSGSITQNATDNANKIQQNQDENTDKIIDNQNQLQENEKNEAETQGQGSVDDVSGAIEDKSAGFISSITSLVSAMSYEGTACAWSFPALKLPAIDGVMPEYQLTEEKPIDFEFWVNKIPSNVLLLVRSVLTVALIGYCFKELYNTISYVLTLKGGGNNE